VGRLALPQPDARQRQGDILGDVRPLAIEQPIAILTGIAAEADIARRITDRVACSAGRPDRAAELARTLIAAGTRTLISFGIAGGLSPDLKAGSLIVADRVMTDHGTYPADANCAEALGARTGALYGGQTIVWDPAEKAALATRTGALAVDLESGPAAAAASDAGIRFLAIRAVADPAWFALPRAALLPLDDEGRPRLSAILGSVARYPAQIPALIRTGLATRAALATLLRAGGVLVV
jgi:hopanoid-associated phosphorylase